MRFYLLLHGSYSKSKGNQDGVAQEYGPEYHVEGTVSQTLATVAHLQ